MTTLAQRLALEASDRYVNQIKIENQVMAIYNTIISSIKFDIGSKWYDNFKTVITENKTTIIDQSFLIIDPPIDAEFTPIIYDLLVKKFEQDGFILKKCTYNPTTGVMVTLEVNEHTERQ